MSNVLVLDIEMLKRSLAALNAVTLFILKILEYKLLLLVPLNL